MESKVNNQDTNRILLEETFYVLTKKSCVFKVRLTKSGLCLIKECENYVKEQIIPIIDIIGCRCLRSKKQTKQCVCHSLSRSRSLEVVEESSLDLDDEDTSAYLYIYAYIFHSTNKESNKRRERTIITLRFRSFDKYEDNYKEAQKWRTVIKKLIKQDYVTLSSISEFTIDNKDKENRRLLVLCNPKSGAGRGKYIFQQKVAPILQEAEIPYDLHLTKYANFAREFVRTNNLYQWSGILVVGGDGIVFEVINGIFERGDWSEIMKSIPVGVVPGGSGNGLARSIAYYYSEPYLPTPFLPSAMAAVRNSCAPMDLVRVETTSQIMFSFLSVGWGLLSDIDIESERFRMLGGQRFTVWSIARLIGLRSYSGKVWYLPSEDTPNSPKQLGTSEIGSNLDLPSEVNLETQPATGTTYASTDDSGIGEATPRDKPRMYGPASQIPGLPATLPPTWKCIVGRFVMVYASYQSHLGENCLFAPDARLDDGKIWLLVIHAGASRTQLLNFLLGLSTGAHAIPKSKDGLVEFFPVNAFRIEPDMTETGYMTVDGELVTYGPIQAEVFPALGRVMVP